MIGPYVPFTSLLGDGPESLVRLVNPMSREGEVLRPNLVPGLLRACAHNLRNGVGAVRLFETGVGLNRFVFASLRHENSFYYMNIKFKAPFILARGISPDRGVVKRTAFGENCGLASPDSGDAAVGSS